MIKKVLISVALTPIIYILIAVMLTMLPVDKSPSGDSLDFEQLPSPDRVSVSTFETSMVARDGNRLFYRLIKGGSDLVIVLMHGSGADGRYLLPMAEMLHKQANATVVIPDLRGHGRSALGQLGDVSYLGQYDHDLEDLNLLLREAFPKSNIVLGGHSSGGGLALRYGGNGLAAFDSYLFLAPYLGFDAPTVRPNSGGWVTVSTRRYVGLSMLNRVQITALNGTRVLFFNRPETIDDPLLADSYSYRLNQSFAPASFEDDLSANTKPILVLVGQDDEAFYANQFEPIFQKNAPLAEVYLLPDIKHLDLVHQPEAVDLIIEWLALDQ